MLQENLSYINKLKLLGTKPGLEPTLQFTKLLGNPQNGFPSIHIAGTNGKGSTSTMIANILKEAGYRVGLYLSPYVVSFNERMQINGKQISEEDLDRLITKLRKMIEKKNLEITFFEFVTSLAFLYFAEQKIDIAVIEVGLGGRLDATNVIKPLISAITNIGMDHQDLLGETKQKIAIEKAGVIKENQVFVTSEEDREISDYFKKICKEKDTNFIHTNDKITTTSAEQTPEGQKFSTKGIFNDNFPLSLQGKHQISNASLALTIVNELQKQDFNIPINSIKKGLNETILPGRLQIVSKNPLTILDGAHNTQGMLALKEFMSPMKNKKVLIIGIRDNKESEEMLKVISPLFENIIVTEGRFRPKKAGIIAEEAKKYNQNVIAIPKVSEAIKKAKALVSNNELILITGSLYLVSDALRVL